MPRIRGTRERRDGHSYLIHEPSQKRKSLMGRINSACDRILFKLMDNIATFIVLGVVLAALLIVAGAIWGDDRNCIRREPSTYIMQNGIMTPIPGSCIEYETEGR